MRIGFITEDLAGQAVIGNILDAILEEYTPIFIRPNLRSDATDRALKDAAAAGGLSRVKADCNEGKYFDEFFILDNLGEDRMVVQADTAEIESFGVVRPSKDSEDYILILRQNTIDKIHEWLEGKYTSQLLHAISIEEIEAWILPLYEEKDASKTLKPKEALNKILSKKDIDSRATFSNYLGLSKGLSKKKTLKAAMKYNQSLELFYEEVVTQTKP